MPIHPLNFLDVNCGIGAYYNPPRGLDPSPEALLRKMDELGIAESAVFHFKAQQYNYSEGNSTLVKEISGEPRLRPVLLVGPHHTGEVSEPKELCEFMKVNDARILKMYFGVQPFVPGPDPFLLGPLLDSLAQRRVILLLEYANHLDIHMQWLRDILEDWPDVKIVLIAPKYEYHDRYFYALWERYDNFFLELAGYQGLGSIEAVVERFGAERILYGSRYPYFTPLQTMLQIIYAEIDDEAKRKIAGDNVRKLLEDVAL
jgi:predicted TIM-barrel fold metal-dependent hydrolase